MDYKITELNKSIKEYQSIFVKSNRTDKESILNIYTLLIELSILLIKKYYRNKKWNEEVPFDASSTQIEKLLSSSDFIIKQPSTIILFYLRDYNKQEMKQKERTIQLGNK